MSESGGPPTTSSFSTSYWRESMSRYPRPALYLSVAAAYSLFVLFMLPVKSTTETQFFLPSFVLSLLGPGHIPEAMGLLPWLVAVCSLALAIVPAVAAARRTSGCKWRDGFRKLLAGAPPGGKKAALSARYRDEVLRVATAPCLAAGLLAPLYVTVVLVAAPFKADLPSRLGLGLLVWGQAAASVLAAAAAGAAAAQGCPRRKSGWMGAAAALCPLALRVGVLLLAGLLTAVACWCWELPSPLTLTATTASAFLAVDIVACIAIWRWLLRRGARRLIVSLPRDKRELGEADLVAESPEQFGLEVSICALWRWKFFRDPIFRAERKLFWTWPRLIFLWLAMAAFGTILALGFWAKLDDWLLYLAAEGHVDLRNWGEDLMRVIHALPFLLVAVMTACSLAADRQSGLLDSLFLTPVAPLRLLAAKLAGKSLHVLLAYLGLEIVLGAIFEWWRPRRHYFPLDEPWWLVSAASSCLWMLGSLLRFLLYGAVGLYFAARCRSLAVAVGSTVVFLILFKAIEASVFAPVYVFFSPEPGQGVVLAAEYAIFGFQTMLIYGTVTSAFLKAAARQLVVRRQ